MSGAKLPPPTVERIAQESPRLKARITGALYLLTILTGIFAPRRIAHEQDPKKLNELIAKLGLLLEQREKSLKAKRSISE